MLCPLKRKRKRRERKTLTHKLTKKVVKNFMERCLLVTLAAQSSHQLVEQRNKLAAFDAAPKLIHLN